MYFILFIYFLFFFLGGGGGGGGGVRAGVVSFYTCILGSFLKVNVKNGNILLFYFLFFILFFFFFGGGGGVLKFEICFGVCLIS